MIGRGKRGSLQTDASWKEKKLNEMTSQWRSSLSHTRSDIVAWAVDVVVYFTYCRMNPVGVIC